MKFIMSFLKVLRLLLNIPKPDDLESLYDAVYTVYQQYDYNKDHIPVKIKSMLLSFSDRVYSACMRILKHYKADLEDQLQDLLVEKEYTAISKKDPVFFDKKIEYISNSLTFIIKILSLKDYDKIEKVLIILYNDIDGTLTDKLCDTLYNDLLPDFQEEVEGMIRRYTIKYIWYELKKYIKRKLRRRHKPSSHSFIFYNFMIVE